MVIEMCNVANSSFESEYKLFGFEFMDLFRSPCAVQ
jgi:hypothetical protein